MFLLKTITNIIKLRCLVKLKARAWHTNLIRTFWKLQVKVPLYLFYG